MAEECAGGAAPDEECPPVVVSWEGSADIQSGDILIVRIADSLLLETFEPRNSSAVAPTSLGVNHTRALADRWVSPLLLYSLSLGHDAYVARMNTIDLPAH